MRVSQVFQLLKFYDSGETPYSIRKVLVLVFSTSQIDMDSRWVDVGVTRFVHSQKIGALVLRSKGTSVPEGEQRIATHSDNVTHTQKIFYLIILTECIASIIHNSKLTQRDNVYEKNKQMQNPQRSLSQVPKANNPIYIYTLCLWDIFVCSIIFEENNNIERKNLQTPSFQSDL